MSSSLKFTGHVFLRGRLCKTKVMEIRRWRISPRLGNFISSSQVLSFVYCRFFVCYRKFSTFILSSIRGKLFTRGEKSGLEKEILSSRRLNKNKTKIFTFLCSTKSQDQRELGGPQSQEFLKSPSLRNLSQARAGVVVNLVQIKLLQPIVQIVIFIMNPQFLYDLNLSICYCRYAYIFLTRLGSFVLAHCCHKL